MATMTIEQALALALQHHQAGRWSDAEHIYRQILAQQPNHIDALHMLGALAHQLGRNDVAVNLIGQAIAHKPNFPEAYSNLGEALRAQGRTEEAIAAYRQAIALKPDYAQAYSNLAIVLKEKGQLDDAIAASRRAIVIHPRYPEAHYNLGIALKENGEQDAAIAAYRQAIALNPDYALAYCNLGNVLSDKGEMDEAIAAYRQAVTLRPNFPEACNNLGSALKNKGQFADAIAAFRRAIALNPNLPEAHSNLGNALTEINRLDDAIAAYEAALLLKANYPEVHGNIGNVLKNKGQLDEAVIAYRRAIALKEDLLEAHSGLLLTLHYLPSHDAKMIADEHRRWNRQFAEPPGKFIQPHLNNRDPDRRLRVGYLSPDFREHVVARFLLPLLEHHDKRQVEVFAYSHVRLPDEMTDRLRSHVDGWRSIVWLSDAQAADLIRKDKIDILVDLAMHAAKNRLLVFARKPAPVQVTHLAYCSTTGLEAMDYRLSDPYLDPLDNARDGPFDVAHGGPLAIDDSIYSEKTIRLAKSYWCYQPSIAPLEVGPPPVLHRGFITFGCLNNFCKVSEPVLSAWSQIMRAVPDSRLLLHAHEGSHRQRLLDRLEREGIEARRVHFSGFVSTLRYFEQYREIDIALDTFPYAGGTTTCDALWMGVPVITLVGKTAVGRGGVSILSNIGLPKLVGETEEAYVRIAVDLANDRERLAELRATLRGRMEHSPLMDAAGYARDVEAAYRQMWRAWCEKSSR